MKRFLALILSVVTLCTQVVFAHSAEVNLWEQRRQALAAQPSSASQLSLPPLSRSTPASGLNGLPALLASHGVVRTVQKGKPGSPVVVFVQDIHGHPEAQKNIGEMVRNVLDANPAAVVGLEGAAGRVSMEKFRVSTTDTNRSVGSFFLNTGLISGVEYAGFAAKQSPHLVGVEDKELYLTNVTAVKAALPLQKEVQGRIEREKTQLQLQKQSVYTPELMTLDQKWREYHAGTLNVGDYLTAMKPPLTPPLYDVGGNNLLSLFHNGEVGRGFHQITLFLKTWDLEKTINIPQAEEQRNRLIARLVAKLPPAELNELVRASAALRNGTLAYPDFYRELKQRAEKSGLPLTEVPEFNRYVTYVLQADAIQPEKFLAEVGEFEKAVWVKACRTPQQREISRQAWQLNLEEKLAGLRLTPVEWKEYLRLNPSGSPAHLQPFRDFYTAAEARNEAIAHNLLKETSDHSIAVLVAGGFHTEGLNRLFAQKDLTVITVVPKLKQVDPELGHDYLNVFTRDRTPLEKLFEAPKISLVMTPAIAPIAPDLNKSADVAPDLTKLAARADEEARSGGQGEEESDSTRVVASRNGQPDNSDHPLVLEGNGEGTYFAVYELIPEEYREPEEGPEPTPQNILNMRDRTLALLDSTIEEASDEGRIWLKSLRSQVELFYSEITRVPFDFYSLNLAASIELNIVVEGRSVAHGELNLSEWWVEAVESVFPALVEHAIESEDDDAGESAKVEGLMSILEGFLPEGFFEEMDYFEEAFRQLTNDQMVELMNSLRGPGREDDGEMEALISHQRFEKIRTIGQLIGRLQTDQFVNGYAVEGHLVGSSLLDFYDVLMDYQGDIVDLIDELPDEVEAIHLTKAIYILAEIAVEATNDMVDIISQHLRLNAGEHTALLVAARIQNEWLGVGRPSEDASELHAHPGDYVNFKTLNPFKLIRSLVVGSIILFHELRHWLAGKLQGAETNFVSWHQVNVKGDPTTRLRAARAGPVGDLILSLAAFLMTLYFVDISDLRFISLLFNAALFFVGFLYSYYFFVAGTELSGEDWRRINNLKKVIEVERIEQHENNLRATLERAREVLQSRDQDAIEEVIDEIKDEFEYLHLGQGLLLIDFLANPKISNEVKSNHISPLVLNLLAGNFEQIILWERLQGYLGKNQLDTFTEQIFKGFEIHHLEWLTEQGPFGYKSRWWTNGTYVGVVTVACLAASSQGIWGVLAAFFGATLMLLFKVAFFTKSTVNSFLARIYRGKNDIVALREELRLLEARVNFLTTESLLELAKLFQLTRLDPEVQRRLAEIIRRNAHSLSYEEEQQLMTSVKLGFINGYVTDPLARVSLGYLDLDWPRDRWFLPGKRNSPENDPPSAELDLFLEAAGTGISDLSLIRPEFRQIRAGALATEFLRERFDSGQASNHEMVYLQKTFDQTGWVVAGPLVDRATLVLECVDALLLAQRLYYNGDLVLQNRGVEVALLIEIFGRSDVSLAHLTPATLEEFSEQAATSYLRRKIPAGEESSAANLSQLEALRERLGLVLRATHHRHTLTWRPALLTWGPPPERQPTFHFRVTPHAYPMREVSVLKLNASRSEFVSLAQKLLSRQAVQAVATPSLYDWSMKNIDAVPFPAADTISLSRPRALAHLLPLQWEQSLDESVDRLDMFVVSGALGRDGGTGNILVYLPHAEENIPPEFKPYEETSSLAVPVRQRVKPVAGETQLLDQFIAKEFSNLDERLQSHLRAAFEKFMLGVSTASELVAELQWVGIGREACFTLIGHLLMTGKTNEVNDRRPFTLAERVDVLERQLPFLTEAGQAALAELKAARMAQRLESVHDLFPSVEHPHLEYFVPLSADSDTVDDVLRQLASLRISDGCSKGCQHCFFAPSSKVQIMPFYRILHLLQKAQGREIHRSGSANDPLGEHAITLFYNAEPFDYYDPLFDADLGDVITAINKAMPKQQLHLTTRGWYLGDQIGPRAAKKIQAVMEKNRDLFNIRVSMDMFDVKGDLVRYIVRVLSLLRYFPQTAITVSATSAEENVGNTRQLVQIIEELARTFVYRLTPVGIQIKSISPHGRATDIDPDNNVFDVGHCMLGNHIMPDGRVLRNQHVYAKGTGIEHQFVETGIRLWGEQEPIPGRVPSPTGKKQAGFAGFDTVSDGIGATAYPEEDEQVFYDVANLVAVLTSFLLLANNFHSVYALLLGLAAGFGVVLLLAWPFIRMHNKVIYETHSKHFQVDGQFDPKLIASYRRYLLKRHLWFGATTLGATFTVNAHFLPLLHNFLEAFPDPSGANPFLPFALVGLVFSIMVGQESGIKVHKHNNSKKSLLWKGVVGARANSKDEPSGIADIGEILIEQIFFFSFGLIPLVVLGVLASFLPIPHGVVAILGPVLGLLVIAIPSIRRRFIAFHPVLHLAETLDSYVFAGDDPRDVLDAFRLRYMTKENLGHLPYRNMIEFTLRKAMREDEALRQAGISFVYRTFNPDVVTTFRYEAQSVLRVLGSLRDEDEKIKMMLHHVEINHPLKFTMREIARQMQAGEWKDSMLEPALVLTKYPLYLRNFYWWMAPLVVIAGAGVYEWMFLEFPKALAMGPELSGKLSFLVVAVFSAVFLFGSPAHWINNKIFRWGPNRDLGANARGPQPEKPNPPSSESAELEEKWGISVVQGQLPIVVLPMWIFHLLGQDANAMFLGPDRDPATPFMLSSAPIPAPVRKFLLGLSNQNVILVAAPVGKQGLDAIRTDIFHEQFHYYQRFHQLTPQILDFILSIEPRNGYLRNQFESLRSLYSPGTVPHVLAIESMAYAAQDAFTGRFSFDDLISSIYAGQPEMGEAVRFMMESAVPSDEIAAQVLEKCEHALKFNEVVFEDAYLIQDQVNSLATLNQALAENYPIMFLFLAPLEGIGGRDRGFIFPRDAASLRQLIEDNKVRILLTDRGVFVTALPATNGVAAGPQALPATFTVSSELRAQPDLPGPGPSIASHGEPFRENLNNAPQQSVHTLALEFFKKHLAEFRGGQVMLQALTWARAHIWMGNTTSVLFVGSAFDVIPSGRLQYLSGGTWEQRWTKDLDQLRWPADEPAPDVIVLFFDSQDRIERAGGNLPVSEASLRSIAAAYKLVRPNGRVVVIDSETSWKERLQLESQHMNLGSKFSPVGSLLNEVAGALVSVPLFHVVCEQAMKVVAQANRGFNLRYGEAPAANTPRGWFESLPENIMDILTQMKLPAEYAYLNSIEVYEGPVSMNWPGISDKIHVFALHKPAEEATERPGGYLVDPRTAAGLETIFVRLLPVIMAIFGAIIIWGIQDMPWWVGAELAMVSPLLYKYIHIPFRGFRVTQTDPIIHNLTVWTFISALPLLAFPWFPAESMLVYAIGLVPLSIYHHLSDNPHADVTLVADEQMEPLLNQTVADKLTWLVLQGKSREIIANVGPMQSRLLWELFELDPAAETINRRLLAQVQIIDQVSADIQPWVARTLLKNAAYLAGRGGMPLSDTKDLLQPRWTARGLGWFRFPLALQWIHGWVTQAVINARIWISMTLNAWFGREFKTDAIIGFHLDPITDPALRQSEQGKKLEEKLRERVAEWVKAGKKDQDVLIATYEPTDDEEENHYRMEAAARKLRTILVNEGGDLGAYASRAVYVARPNNEVMSLQSILAEANEKLKLPTIQGVRVHLYTLARDQFDQHEQGIRLVLFALSGQVFWPVSDQVKTARVFGTNA